MPEIDPELVQQLNYRARTGDEYSSLVLQLLVQEDWQFKSLENCKSSRQKQLATFIDKFTGLEFSLIQGGSWDFVIKKRPTTQVTEILGSSFEFPVADNDFSSSKTASTTVQIAPFLIAKSLVSQELWDRHCSEWKLVDKRTRSKPDLGIHMVGWDDASRFARLTGLRLPSDIEWDFAFYGSGEFSGDLMDMKPARNYGGLTTSVQQSPKTLNSNLANNFGLYDMIGHFKQWCGDNSRPETGEISDLAWVHESREGKDSDPKTLRGLSHINVQRDIVFHGHWGRVYDHESGEIMRSDTGFRLASSITTRERHTPFADRVANWFQNTFGQRLKID